MVCLMFVEQRGLVYLKAESGVLLKLSFRFSKSINIRYMYFVYIINLIMVSRVVCDIGEASILVWDYKYK
ncbi:hypothetical protein DBP88_07255 [Enterobacter hormaechei]|uniref:Uncharacterized protein n=1 Tax=Enterobacter hormaechei TaxID=158836 RepID=A0A9X7Q441_9ENTR|nr:hypothetical protein ECNIH3_04650 [Enterobacter hormaechei subsp. hoffmannii ECNIH3]AIN26958.1 hypothetical protein ECR091_04630 [Enterobacter hormaechei subsp. hoffmannii ECR091]AIX58083.1 hypothetical protein ECNIH5_04645 [Enterobacter cloacae]AOP98872.1 hypothetical protein BFV65_04420 [Enterobacter hormaechei subsp. hoffmannii]AVZ13222.1 hypothetical protein DBP88_07255 [Enterobacter hormaechei]POU06960.1 hypothetical protein C3376_07115 [Enterobacter cloacae complex sp. ECNIH17]POV306